MTKQKHKRKITDKMRLDWIEKQGRSHGWVATHGIGGTFFLDRNVLATSGEYMDTARKAIDEAMSNEK